MLKLIPFLKDYKKQVILGPVFKLIEAIFELIVPLVMAKIIDVGVKNGDIFYVFKMGGILVFLGIVGYASSLTCQRYAAIASQGFGTTVRNKLFYHINTLSHSEIDKIGTPSLITRIINDVNQLQFAVAMLIRLVVRAPFLAIGATIMAMLIDFKLSTILLVTTLIIIGILYLVMSKSIPYYHALQKKLDKISLITRENLGGARVIRSFSKQDAEQNRFYEASNELSNTSIAVGKISALLNPMTYIAVNLAIVGIIWFGGIRVEVGHMTQGQVIAYVNYMTQILLALIVVANLVVVFTKASASATRVNEVLGTKSSIVEYKSSNKDKLEIQSVAKIEFKNVWFSYDASDKYVIKNANIKMYKNETIGIIGGTGSGKSTLINLIPRFYDVTKGEILVDGTNIKDYPIKALRKKIGVVPQRAVLFAGTIKENIRWGLENATEEDINKALSTAQAIEFVNQLPNRLDTMIEQGGKNLSGGQKQRLTIARAIVANPDILILDDSSSALDFATDAALRQAIKKETQDNTVIIVSQRISTIKNADKIIVLDNGDVVGIGTHKQLTETCSVYKEICLSQLSKKEGDK